jgi:hypothetical protein
MAQVLQVNNNIQTQSVTGEADGIQRVPDGGMLTHPQKFNAGVTPTGNPNGSGTVVYQFGGTTAQNLFLVRNPR